MHSKTTVTLSVIVGLIFIGIAIMYWTTPTGSLPSFVPGYVPGGIGVHTKHGLLAAILAVLCFIFAWFKSGKKQQPTAP